MLDLNNLENLTQKLGKEFIAPYAQEIDQKARFPKEEYEALKQQGFIGLLIPKEYGCSPGVTVSHIHT